jgi:hypothetical protein
MFLKNRPQGSSDLKLQHTAYYNQAKVNKYLQKDTRIGFKNVQSRMRQMLQII